MLGCSGHLSEKYLLHAEVHWVQKSSSCKSEQRPVQSHRFSCGFFQVSGDRRHKRKQTANTPVSLIYISASLSSCVPSHPRGYFWPFDGAQLTAGDKRLPPTSVTCARPSRLLSLISPLERKIESFSAVCDHRC